MSYSRDIRASQIDYSVSTKHSPVYRFLRIQLHNHPSSKIVADNTQQLVEWKLPGNAVYNLKRSKIGYHYKLPASTATWTHEDAITLATDVYFGNAGGANLCDLKFAGNYTKIANKIDTKFEDYMTNDETECLYPCNTDISLNPYPLPTSATVLTGKKGSVAYNEPRYVEEDSAERDVYRMIPLSSFKNTILNVDKDLYFGNEQFLRLNTAPLNRVAWRTTTFDEPATGATDVAASVNINQLYLYLAVETNELIVASIKDKFDRGQFKINIPYTVGFMQSSSVPGPNNINVQITKQYGKRLLQVLYSAFDADAKYGKAYDCYNYNGQRLVSYRTALDSKYLQDYTLTCLESDGPNINNDDWHIANKKYCKNTVILNEDVYKKNWFHLDKFYEPNQDVSIDNLDVGLELPVQTMNYIIETNVQLADPAKPASDPANATRGLMHHVWLTFRRTVLLTKDGIFYETDPISSNQI